MVHVVLKPYTVYLYILLLLFQCRSVAILERDAISNLVYTIEPVITGSHMYLKINCSIFLNNLPDNDFSLRLNTPFKEGPASLVEGFQNFRIVQGARAIVQEQQNGAQYLLDGISSTTITVSYTIVPTIEDITYIGNPTLYYKPILSSRFFYATGRGIFVYPDWINPEKRSIQVPTNLIWRNIPTNWRVANSFGVNCCKQQFLAQPEQLAKGIFMGGDYVIKKFDCLGYPMYIAMRSEWQSLTIKSLADTIAPLIRSQRAFWSDVEFPFFIVALLCVSPSSAMIAGDSATNGIKLYLPRDATIDQRLIHLVGHELFHTWNGQVITFLPDAEWFHQGFTDYYADQCALRAGILSFQDYITAYNHILVDYYSSPYIDLPNGEIQKRYWSNYAINVLPYRRGYLLAHNWNGQLKAASKNTVSIDDIMRKLRKQTTIKKCMFSEQLLIDLCKEYIPDIEKQIQQYVVRGVPIQPEAQAFGSLCSLIEKEIPIIDYGFDFNESMAAMMISGVDHDGPAYKAGLRDSDRIIEILSKPPTMVTDLIRFKIQHSDGAHVTIQYHPNIQKMVKIPQYDSV